MNDDCPKWCDQKHDGTFPDEPHMWEPGELAFARITTGDEVEARIEIDPPNLPDSILAETARLIAADLIACADRLQA